MSRSYKKHAILKDSCKGMKKIANSVVRHSKNIPNGKQYRKLFNSWDISDWRFVYEKDDEWYAKSKRK